MTTYYKVKRDYDSYNLNDKKLLKDCKLKTLVKDELFTQHEVKVNNIPYEALEAVDIKEGYTFVGFGARFEVIED